MQYYIKAIKDYAKFEGRARRKEYWMFLLFQFLFLLVAFLLDGMLGLRIGGIGYGWLYILYSLFTFLPALAVGVRRLHDVGKSGWFMLIVLVPIIGGIWLIVLYCTDGVKGPNQYGPNPKETA